MFSRFFDGVDVSNVVPFEEMENISKTMNYAKNASLYAGEHEGSYAAPSDLFKLENAESIMSLNNKLYKFITLVPIQDVNEFVKVISSLNSREIVINLVNEIKVIKKQN